MTLIATKRAAVLPAYVYDSLLVIGGSLLIAIAAQISVSLPFTPVPFSLQSQAVLLLAYLLGSRRAFMAVAAYLMEGALGLPVFTQGSFGLATLLGPRAGYFAGFLVSSYVVGLLFERLHITERAEAFAAFVAGNVLLMLCGAAWLSILFGVEAAWNMGVYPFILSDLLKISMLAISLPGLRRVAGWIA